MKNFNDDPTRTEIMDLAIIVQGYKINSEKTKDSKEYADFQRKIAKFDALGIAKSEEWLRQARPGYNGQKNTEDWFKTESVNLWKGTGSSGWVNIQQHAKSVYGGHDTIADPEIVTRMISSFEKKYITAPTPKSVEEMVREGIEAQLPGAVAAALKVKEAERQAEKDGIFEDVKE